MMRRPVVGALAVIAVFASACSSERDDAAAGPRLVPLAGPVSLVRGDETADVSEPLSLVPGDTVRSSATGARIEWPDGQILEIAPETELELGHEAPELVAGSVLAQSPGGLVVRAGAAQIEGAAGIFRVDRGISLRVGVYRGVATIPAPGEDDSILALRQAFVPAVAGTVAEEPEPLEIDPSDPWDARLLGQAIDIGLRLADLQRGLSAQLRGAADVARSVLADDFAPATLSRFSRNVAAADLVVSAQAALLAARQNDLTPAALLADILSFRGQGASWPVVVAAWNLQRAELIAAVSRVTEIIASLLVPSFAGAGGPGAGPGTEPGVGSPGTPGEGGPTDGGTPPDEPPNDGTDPRDPPNPPDPPDPPDPPECEGTVDCLVDDVLGVTTDLST